MLMKGYESMNIVPQILPLARIIVYVEVEKRRTRKITTRTNNPRTLRNQFELLLAITNTRAEPTMRPPNDSPRDVGNNEYESGRAYGSRFEFEGGSVVQNVAIVVRSSPACPIPKW